MKTKVITIGVLTFNNSEKELLRWYRSFVLASRRAEGSYKFKLLCLDNGETSWLSHQSDVTTLPSLGNIGFAKGVNHLMKTAFEDEATECFITCNPDGYFHPQCLRNLIVSFETISTALIEARTFPEEHPKTYDFKTGKTNWAVGCCLLIPKDIYSATRGFDPHFFLYLEDVDFSWRCRALGYQVIYSANSLYGHGLQGRVEGSTPRRLQLLKAGAYFAKKWQIPKGFRACLKEWKEMAKKLGVQEAPEIPHTEKFDGSRFNEGEFFIFSNLRW